MNRIVTIVGARPQFIKAAAVSRVLRAHRGLEEILVHTGQHYDEKMSDIFFDELNIPKPDFNLGVGSQNHGAQTAQMLAGIEEILLKTKPQWVLVYGDTNSTLAGALAASKLHINVAHIEAGLRSFNKKMPEEINRVLTDHISTLLFCPTKTAIENLKREGVPESQIHFVGDVMFDASRFYAEKAERSSILDQLGLSPQNYILTTVHRAENTDNISHLRAIFDGLASLDSALDIVVPLHPRTKNILDKEKGFAQNLKKLRFIEPVGYLEMIALEKNARLIATDSGGVQKEAYFYQVPCVTLREETEWVELVESGWNRLVKPKSALDVASGISQALNFKTPKGKVDFYGDGHAAQKITMVLSGDLK